LAEHPAEDWQVIPQPGFGVGVGVGLIVGIGVDVGFAVDVGVGGKWFKKAENLTL
jgi:hypothetical protein